LYVLCFWYDSPLNCEHFNHVQYREGLVKLSKIVLIYDKIAYVMLIYTQILKQFNSTNQRRLTGNKLIDFDYK